jgi:hypothetical protein
MSEPHSITPGMCEILVARELRRAGIEPIGLRRRAGAIAERDGGCSFDLIGRLEAYGRRWRALIGCRITADPVEADHVGVLRRRADEAHASSALFFATAAFLPGAARRAEELRVALLRIVSTQQAMPYAATTETGSLPAWTPEYTVEIVSAQHSDGVHAQQIQPGDAEQILEHLRPRPA